MEKTLKARREDAGDRLCDVDAETLEHAALAFCSKQGQPDWDKVERIVAGVRQRAASGDDRFRHADDKLLKFAFRWMGKHGGWNGPGIERDDYGTGERVSPQGARPARRG